MNGSWISALWPVSRKSASDDKAVIGILASEVSWLMLKVVNLWHSLRDHEVMSLRAEIVNSLGVKMLVSNDDSFLMELALNEILNNYHCLARSVARLSKRCEDQVYHRYEQFVDNPVWSCFQWSGWEYRWEKMDRKVKKMERFAAAMSRLSQELEVLAEREQTFKRMRANPEMSRAKLLKFKKKVTMQRQEVKTLRGMTPWNRSYDYIVRLLARSLFTILERIVHVFGNYPQQPIEQREDDYECVLHTVPLRRSFSFSTPMHLYVHSQNNQDELDSEQPGRRHLFNSSGLVADKNKRKKKQQQALHLEIKQLGRTGGCVSAGTDSPIVAKCGSMRSNDCRVKYVEKTKTADNSRIFNRISIYSKLSINSRLRPVQFTLGDAALALHYAKVIILIEKIASSPDMVDSETRDNMYIMLPTTIKTALRAKLRRGGKRKASSGCDLAEGWKVVVTQTLGWLAPLAHSMVRWHSERNFEKEHATPKATILLVQTLYFANQAKAEGAIVELLVGLNYIFRIHKQSAGLKRLA